MRTLVSGASRNFIGGGTLNTGRRPLTFVLHGNNESENEEGWIGWRWVWGGREGAWEEGTDVTLACGGGGVGDREGVEGSSGVTPEMEVCSQVMRATRHLDERWVCLSECGHLLTGAASKGLVVPHISPVCSMNVSHQARRTEMEDVR